VAVEADLLSLADIRAAAGRIQPYVLRTPTLSGEALAGTGVWLKAENLQRTGSFKARGAVNAVLQLSPEQRHRGVITLSAGNHGMALAYAAQAFGIPCVVVVREDAAIAKLAAGQGTVGLEILEAVPDLRTLIGPVGGGGLIAGVAVAVKQRRPEVRMIGVEPEQAPTVNESLGAGHPVEPSRLDTIADGLAAPYTRPFNLTLIQRYVDEMRMVSDTAIIEALKLIVLQAKLVVEPAGAAAVTALLTDPALQRPVVAILSGGNLDGQRLSGWLAG
jgi:threonine dehydratase